VKRQAITLEALSAYPNLELACWKAARGRTHQAAVAKFLAERSSNLNLLAKSILEETAPDGRSSCFVIHDPKRRIIHAPCFVDRVLHHAIFNLAGARFERMLLDSVYACRPGRGVHRAVWAVQQGLQRWPWFVQVDVDAYFPSIRHDLLLAMLARRFKGRGFFDLLCRILEKGATQGPGRGLPIGTLASQHFANGFMDGADRLILNQIGTGAHVRYMDDVFWGCASRESAEDSLGRLEQYLNESLDLRLKTARRIAPSADGLRFCGYRVRQGVILPGPRKMVRYRAAVRRLDVHHRAMWVPESECQRGWDLVQASMYGCTSTRFRHQVLKDCGYSVAPGFMPE
jgi:RNA-directed DNA polymerase